MDLDAFGQKFIQGFEGCRLWPYDDRDGARLTWHTEQKAYVRPDGRLCIGFPTIGWGKRIWPGEVFGVITQAEADAQFTRILVDYVAAVDRQCPSANSHQRAALASFCYNCGSGGLASSGIPAAYAAGQDPKDLWLAAKWSSTRGVLNSGLQYRRAKEYALYMTPVPLTDDEKANVLGLVYSTASQIIGDLYAEPQTDPVA